MGEDIRTCRDVEERLASYVDGEAPPETRRALEAHLAACGPCRDTATAERAGRELVHAHRDALRASAPYSLRARCAAHAGTMTSGGRVTAFESPAASVPVTSRASSLRMRRLLPLSLAASLVLAVAGVFLFGVNDPVHALTTSLALDHVKCFHMADITRLGDADRIEHEWQQEQGWHLTIPRTEAQEGLQLLCIRRCFTSDGKSAHVLYRWHGQPLSLYVLPHEVNAERVVEAMGHEASIWSAGGRTYVVVAAGRPPGFEHIVDYVKTHAQ